LFLTENHSFNVRYFSLQPANIVHRIVHYKSSNSELTDPNDNLAPAAGVSLVPKVGLAGNLP